jgi:hypothetical protein
MEMNFEQGKVVKWENNNKKQIVFLVTDKDNIGVVIHSDSLLSVGTIADLSDYEDIASFVGTVHVKSESNS